MNKFRLLPTSVYIKSSLGDAAKASLYTPMPALSLRCSTGDDFHSAVFMFTMTIITRMINHITTYMGISIK